MEGASIVVEIEVESLNVFRAVSGQAVGCQEGRNLIVRESKDNLEVQRSAFATDDLEAEVTDLFPAGVSLFQFFVEEVFLEITASIKRNVSKVSFKRRWDIQFLADNWYTFIRNNLRIKINVICIIAQKLI